MYVCMDGWLNGWMDGWMDRNFNDIPSIDALYAKNQFMQ